MTTMIPATVLFGDVVDSRRDPGASAFLRSLRDELDASTAHERLAPAGFTQGDEIQVLLASGADPFRVLLRAALHPDARGLRWAVVAGLVEPGTGPATERTGPAFRAAREPARAREGPPRRAGGDDRRSRRGRAARGSRAAPARPARGAHRPSARGREAARSWTGSAGRGRRTPGGQPRHGLRHRRPRPDPPPAGPRRRPLDRSSATVSPAPTRSSGTSPMGRADGVGSAA